MVSPSPKYDNEMDDDIDTEQALQTIDTGTSHIRSLHAEIAAEKREIDRLIQQLSLFQSNLQSPVQSTPSPTTIATTQTTQPASSPTYNFVNYKKLHDSDEKQTNGNNHKYINNNQNFNNDNQNSQQHTQQNNLNNIKNDDITKNQHSTLGNDDNDDFSDDDKYSIDSSVLVNAPSSTQSFPPSPSSVSVFSARSRKDDTRSNPPNEAHYDPSESEQSDQNDEKQNNESDENDENEDTDETDETDQQDDNLSSDDDQDEITLREQAAEETEEDEHIIQDIERDQAKQQEKERNNRPSSQLIASSSRYNLNSDRSLLPEWVDRTERTLFTADEISELGKSVFTHFLSLSSVHENDYSDSPSNQSSPTTMSAVRKSPYS